MSAHLKLYKVWDPASQASSDARRVEATSADDAAHTYAEEDEEGQREGLYLSATGHKLHVMDEHDDAWEVHVCVESMPLAVSVKRARLQ